MYMLAGGTDAIARLTFSGAANQRVTLATTNGSLGWAQFSLIKPDGTNLVGPSWGNNGMYFDAVVLPTTGTYTIILDPVNRDVIDAGHRSRAANMCTAGR